MLTNRGWHGGGTSEDERAEICYSRNTAEGAWDVIGDRSDERELEIEVVEDPVMDGGEVLEFKLGILGMKPFKEGNLVVVQERPLEDVSDPLSLLCVCQQVVDVAGNGRLTYVCDVCRANLVLAPPRCSTKLSIGPVLCRTRDTRHPGTICGVTTVSGW